MVNLDYESWRCMHDEKKFCPPEGCDAGFGCARMEGWDPSQPSPFADPVTGALVPMGVGRFAKRASGG